ncbi:MAG: cytochrome c3 family protein, partial [Candidatus Eiseniibacteriota bacterium]
MTRRHVDTAMVGRAGDRRLLVNRCRRMRAPEPGRPALRRLLLPALLPALLAAICFAAAPAAADQCIECHLALDDETLTPPASGFDDDVHSHAEVSCAGCHGGDPTSDDAEVAMDPARGFVGIPEPSAIPSLCGRCHGDESFMRRFAPSLPTDQEAKYWTSGHGEALAAGVNEAATCVSCHGVHGIRPANDPGSPTYPTNLPRTCNRCHGDADLMARFDLPSDVMADFAGSVHGVALLEESDLGAPACNDCHGSHGAQPPGITSIHYVCGTCHLHNRELFEQSPHAPAFAEAEIKECDYCHGHHAIEEPTDAMLGLGDSAVCGDCHDTSDAGGQVALRLATMVDSLRTLQEEAGSLIHDAEQRGMPVEEAVYELGEGHENLVKMRTEIHAFAVDAVEDDFRSG